MATKNLTSVNRYFQTVWSDFVVKDETSYETNIDLADLTASDTLKSVALSFEKYSGYILTGYGKGTATRGITEQEAYDLWIQDFQTKQKTFKNQIAKLHIFTMPQCVYDGLFFHYFATNNLTVSHAGEGIYEMHTAIVNKDWDTVASMIMRSVVERQKSIRAATILRLADYGKTKNRSRLRNDGIYAMRRDNELGKLRGDVLKRARFAYYAETLTFLPQTPDGIKRDIAKSYEETVLYKQYTYDGTTSQFELLKTPSMDPIEKLEINVNGTPIQHYFDYTVSGTTLTISKELSTGDVIYTKIKI